MKKGLKYAGFGLAGFLIFLVAAPWFVPWSVWKGAVEKAATKAVGTQVSLGNLSGSFLPPRLILEDVSVASPPGFESAQLAHFAEARLAASFHPFAPVKVRLEGIELEKPEINFEKNAEGVSNFQTLLTNKQQPDAQTESGKVPATDSGKGAAAISLENLVIHDGVVRFRKSGQQAQEIRVPSLQVQMPSLLAGPVRVEGQLERAAQKLVFKIEAGPKTDASLPLHLDVSENTFGADIHFNGTASMTEKSLSGALEAVLQKPVTSDLKTQIKASQDSVELTGLSGTVADISARGDMSVRLQKPRPFVDAKLALGTVDVEALRPQTQQTASSGQDMTAQPEAPPRERWSSRPVDLSFLRLLDGRFDLSAESFVAGGLKLEQPALQADLNEGVLTLKSLVGRFREGTLAAHGRVEAGADSQSPSVLALVLDLKNVPFEKPVKEDIAVSGLVSLNLDAKTTGSSQADFVRALSGTGKFEAQNGVLSGMDLLAAARGVQALSNPATLPSLLQGFVEGGQTRFAKFVAPFTIQSGVVKTENAKLEAEGGQVKISGSANLPDWTVDARAEIGLQGIVDLPDFAVVLSGPLDKPNRKVEVANLEKWLLRQGAKRLLKVIAPTPVGAVVGGIVSGIISAPEQSDNEKEKSSLPVNPVDAVKGLLPF